MSKITKIKIGDRFGRLQVIDFAGHKKYKTGVNKLMIKCKCDCGNVVITTSENLLKGSTKSCGCYKSDRMKEVHTGNTYGYKHGECKEKLYASFFVLRSKCKETGIRMCEEWFKENGYENFRKWAYENGYNPNGDKVLTRIDINGPYSPENCKYVYRNQVVTTKTNIITYNGESHSISEWSRITGLPIGTIEFRINSGWSIDKILFTPSERYNFIEYNGNKYSITDWSYALGIPKVTISTRMRNGDTDPADILKKPIRKGSIINAIYFVDENERPINQQDYADGIRVGRKAY